MSCLVLKWGGGAAYLQRTGHEGRGPVGPNLHIFQVRSQPSGCSPSGESSWFSYVGYEHNNSKPSNGPKKALFAKAPLPRGLLPFLLITRASSRVCDSRLALMNITTWSWVCSEMSRPLISTIWSPSFSLGMQVSACTQGKRVSFVTIT